MTDVQNCFVDTHNSATIIAKASLSNSYAGGFFATTGSSTTTNIQKSGIYRGKIISNQAGKINKTIKILFLYFTFKGGIIAYTDGTVTLIEVFVRPEVTLNVTGSGSSYAVGIMGGPKLKILNSYVSANLISTTSECMGAVTNPNSVNFTNSYCDVTMNCPTMYVVFKNSPSSISYNNFYYLNTTGIGSFTTLGVTPFNSRANLQSQVNTTFSQCDIWVSYRLKIETGNNLTNICQIPSTQFPIPTLTTLPNTPSPSSVCIFKVPNCVNCDNENDILINPDLFNISCIQINTRWLYTFKNSSSNLIVLRESVSLNTTIYIEGDLSQAKSSVLSFVSRPNSQKTAKVGVSGCVTINGTLQIILEERPKDNSLIELMTFNCLITNKRDSLKRQQKISDSQITVLKKYAGDNCDDIKPKAQTTPNSLSVSLSVKSSCNSSKTGLIVGLSLAIPFLLIILTLGIIYFYKMKNKKLIKEYNYENQKAKLQN